MKKSRSQTKKNTVRLPKPNIGAPRKSRLPYFMLIVALLGGGYLGATYFLNARDIPLVIGPDTTILTQPLTEDGTRVDYFAALNERFEPKTPVEENGFRQIFRTLRVRIFERTPPDWYLVGLHEKLDVDWALDEAIPVESLETVLEKAYPKDQLPGENDFPPLQKQRQALRKITAEPWTVEEFPFMRDWLQSHTPVIDAIADAARKDVFYVPKLRRSERDPLPLVLDENPRLAARMMIDMLLARAFNHLAGTPAPSHPDAAMDDMVAACRLAIHLSNAPWGYDRSPHLAVYVLEKTVEPLRSRVFDREQLRRFAFEIDRLPHDPYKPEDILFASECEALDVVACLSSGTLSRSHTLVLNTLPEAGKGDGVDWNAVARQVRQVFREVEPLLYEKDPAKRNATVEYAAVHERHKTIRESWYLPTRSKRSQQVGDLLALRIAFSPKYFHLFTAQRETRRELLRLAIALERFRIDKGEYPAALGMLEPTYIPIVPTDPCTNREPFRYALETAPNKPFETGEDKSASPEPVDRKTLGYLLYSVSLDHVDDGGYTQQELMKKAHNGDQRVRMPRDGLFFNQESLNEARQKIQDETP